MNKLLELAKTIFEGNRRGSYSISVDEFRELYRLIGRLCEENNKAVGETQILLLTRDAIIKFEIAPNVVIKVSKKKRISTKDFEVVLSPKFEGNLKPITWGAFIWTELRQNWWVFILVSLFVYIAFYKNNNILGVSTVNQLVIDASAIFISIFVLFTISQNRDLLLNKELLRRGITHQLMQNDFYITSIAIFSLILAFISSSILTLPPNSKVIIPIINIPFYLVTFAIFLTHLAILLLFDCFLSVTRYYLGVMRTSIESQMYLQLMGEKKNDKTNDL